MRLPVFHPFLYTETRLYLTLAPHPVASHLLLISTLARLGDSRDQVKSRETVAKVAEEYLGRECRSATEEKGKGDIFNAQVEKILTVFLVMEVLCTDGVARSLPARMGAATPSHW